MLPVQVHVLGAHEPAVFKVLLEGAGVVISAVEHAVTHADVAPGLVVWVVHCELVGCSLVVRPGKIRESGFVSGNETLHCSLTVPYFVPK